MRLENHWPCVLWLEAMCCFKIVVFGISYYAFLLSIQLYIYRWIFFVITSSMCFNFKTYGYNNHHVFTFVNLDLFNKLGNVFKVFFIASTLLKKIQYIYFLIYFFQIWLHGRVVNINLNVVDMLVDVVDMLSFGSGYAYWCSGYVCWYII